MGFRTFLTQYKRRYDSIPVLGNLPSHLAHTKGNQFHVMPFSGSDVNADGSIYNPFKTLAMALAQCAAGQNDIVFLHAESNTAAQTTDYQNALLDWNKDLVHLIGINSGPRLSSRSRVAFLSSYDAATDLFKLSANGCYVANIEFFMGVAGTTPTGCMTVSGMRNRIENCHIAGFGGAAGANDINGAYSLQLYSAAENLFERCVIGIDTIQLGAATGNNSQILFTKGASGVRRNIFDRCRVQCWTSHASYHNFLRSAATAMDRWNEFRDCEFLNYYTAAGLGTLLTQAFVVAAGTTPAGVVLLTGKTAGWGFTDWNSADSGNVIAMGDSITTNSFGLGSAVTRA
jgi:hypothetical protein